MSIWPFLTMDEAAGYLLLSFEGTFMEAVIEAMAAAYWRSEYDRVTRLLRAAAVQP